MKAVEPKVGIFHLRPSTIRSKPSPRAPVRKSLSRIVTDTLILYTSVWLAYCLRFDWEIGPRYLYQVHVLWPVTILLQYGLLLAFRAAHFEWSYFSLPEAKRVAYAVGSSAAIVLTIRYGLDAVVDSTSNLRLLLVPSSVVLINSLLALIGLTGVRTVRRVQLERKEMQRLRRSPDRVRTAIVIGAGRAGRLLLDAVIRRPDLGIRTCAFVDDDRRLLGCVIRGIRVAGATNELARVAREHGADLALIALASANRQAMHRIVDIAAQAGLETKIVPPLHDLISGRVGISQIRDVAIEDLLGREPVDFDEEKAASVVRDRVVLVTGAGGSIGFELCRQILLLGPRRLVLVERAENALYRIHREFDGARGDLVACIGDVTDETRMRALFTEHRPEVVFHAAAHKHVPIMEVNPHEAIKNNTLGTKQVADLSDEFGVEQFVLISTDKAVNPTSIMGASKRLAELAIQDIQTRSRTRFVAVRFGNVLGSSGSVIPLFREQIAAGGPVTVTHPEMTRYFMTLPEACHLVLQAAALGKRGAVMVLDMGEPVKILDLAHQMIRLSGLEPGTDIEVSFCGLRPGEKLFEELALDRERVDATPLSKVFVWRSPIPPQFSMQQAFEKLTASAGAREEDLRATLMELVPEYRPTNGSSPESVAGVPTGDRRCA